MNEPKETLNPFKMASELIDVTDELESAMATFPPFNSAHEGFAVFKEEVDELWEEVRKNPKERNPDMLRTEAVQCAAMALRFIYDVCDKER